jgi:alkylation response protein AidB-like acyl-CoA dehydrogenase
MLGQEELLEHEANARQPTDGAEFVLTSDGLAGRLAAETARTSTSFTIFEGTSEIRRMIIGRAVTGLDVR